MVPANDTDKSESYPPYLREILCSVNSWNSS